MHINGNSINGPKLSEFIKGTLSFSKMILSQKDDLATVDSVNEKYKYAANDI